MKNILLAIVACIIISDICLAENIYVAQTAKGSDTGVNCTNAHSMAWFNTEGNWQAGIDKISAGDTVHFCGIITSTANVRGSGADGNPITLKFEPGAKFSKAAWGTSTSAAIYVNRRNYITIDGGGVGIIENTDNGTTSAYVPPGSFRTQLDSSGIYAADSIGLQIKNLTIQNIYQRVKDSNDPSMIGFGIYAHNISSGSIQNNTINNSKYGIFAASNTSIAGMNIFGNTISKTSTGIVVALEAAVTWRNVNIYNNTISENSTWAGTWGPGLWHHNDGIHTWGNYAGAVIGPISIYGNTIGGDMGNQTTAWIYLEDYNYPALVYNNVLYADTGKSPPTNGYIYYRGRSASGSLKIYNNTFKGPASTSSGGNAIYLEGPAYTVDVRNNIFNSLRVAIYDETGGNAVKTLDYNNYYNIGNIRPWSNNLAAWQAELGGCPAEGNECNSITSNPMLKADFTLPHNSPVKDAGTNLSGIFNTDKTGLTRYRGYGWDMGAYEYNKPEPPRNLKIK